MVEENWLEEVTNIDLREEEESGVTHDSFGFKTQE